MAMTRILNVDSLKDKNICIAFDDELYVRF